MSDTELRWEEPAAARFGISVWPAIAASLRERPGQWAIVRTCDTHVKASVSAYQIRNGTFTAMPKGQFEAVSRKVGDEFRVYARYVGDPS